MKSEAEDKSSGGGATQPLSREGARRLGVIEYLRSPIAVG